ncbi:MAG: protease modulator HflK [marine bacterium B5-7]|nr:MAG: protease modulator HflK [marine bacterium B5-7]
MPWNQPGSGNDKDPWGQNKTQPSGPPDLDEVVRNIRKKFGGGGGGSGSGGGGNFSMPGKAGILIIAVIAAAIWFVSGFFVVQEGEDAVILRFGKYTETRGAGLRWIPRGIESVTKIDTQRINTVEVGYRENTRTQQRSVLARESLMLTADENIIDIKFAVQFDIKSPEDLLFNVSEPVEDVVRSATESAVREIVGRNTMNFAITDGRAEIAAETRSLLQAVLDRYETGINIRTVEMQNAQPPAEVKPAFDDAVKAREDKERLKNVAEAYANDIIPRARGRSARILQESEAYKATIVNRAEGDASRFTQVLKEYSLAPQVTRDRLYLETMERVFANSTKIMIDQKDGGNSLMYLPIDQILKERARQVESGVISPGGSDTNRGGTSRMGEGAGTDSSSNVRPDRYDNLREARG